MKGVLRNLSVRASRADGTWLTLLLLLVVLAPSACLLWFMNQAVQNERLAVHQKLADAYRGHLSLVQERLNTFWLDVSNRLVSQAQTLPASALFANQIRDQLADGLVCFDATGHVSYPDTPVAAPDEVSDRAWTAAQILELQDTSAAAAAYATLAKQSASADLAARALQAQARCLLQAGRKPAAITVLAELLAGEQYAHAKDGNGRLVVPNAQLMALELSKDSNLPQADSVFEHLKTRLLDYDDGSMCAAQRRFLMHQLEELFPRRAAFPTLAAEELAARYLEAGAGRPTEPGLRATGLPGVWQWPCSNGRLVTLHTTENLAARLQAAVLSPVLPADVKVAFIPPGKEGEGLLTSMPAGEAMPAWRLGLALPDQRLFDTAAEQRVAAYVWIGVLAVATIAVLGALALRLLRRQMALTQLRNDLVANVTHELKTPLSSMRLLVETLLDSESLNEQTAREYLQLIARENNRLSRLIDNFLTFSRIERNKYAFGFKEVPAQVIVEGAAAAAGERFHSPGCRFTVEMSPNLPPLLADVDAMVTVLVNLLDNAYKYSGEEKQITLSAGAENGHVSFAVKDNGIGLSARETKRIFKRFYQVDQRLSRTGGGCGLGLSIVKFVVRAHHGAVQVQSQPERGSTFIVTLPAADSHASSGPEMDQSLRMSASTNHEQKSKS